jgi:AraC family transcriptional regulator of adaptative response / DNA-3-methyladenine glycosylase II
MDFWEHYRAIGARDTRFDGQFVTAVSSTGIYCRPSCPARTPKPDNVRFYRTSAAAHEAGYRACKRCLPEAVPGNPEWNLRGDVAARAMRLVADGEVDRTGVSGLAARLGYSPRHLNRILHQEAGAGALALARAQRAQTARTLLAGSSLTFADVAFAAGFGSIRQFNDTVQQVFQLTPGQVRTASRRSDRAVDVARPDGGMIHLVLNLPVRLPYDGGIFRFLAASAVEGVELATDRSYERLLLLPSGPAWFRARPVEDRGGGRGVLPVTVAVSGLGDLPVLLARIRRLFDLDADPSAIDAVLRRDPFLGRLARAAPGLRLPGSLDPHETLLRAIAGQQVTLPVATEALGRLAASGPAFDLPGSALTRVFPSAEHLAAAPEPLLTGPGYRSEALRTVAARLADGSLDVGVGSDPVTLRDTLLSMDGVGSRTADYVLMRVLGRPDVHLRTDAAVLAGWSRVADCDPPSASTPPASPPSLERSMDAVRPWRSYATLHLWRAAAPATSHAPAGRDAA